MEKGKLTIEQLKNIVFPYIGSKRSEVVVSAAIGEDCGVIDFSDDMCVISTDPITGASKENGYLGVHVACNDIIASGGKPLGILVTLLLHVDVEEEDILNIVKGIDKASKELNIQIVGGHTEITDNVNESILSFTAIGTKSKDSLKEKNIEALDEIILTKGGGIEGTAIIYNDYANYFRGHISSNLIEEGQNMINWLSVYKEGMLAIENGAKVMHDVTEGGVLGGLYELAETTNLGILIDESKIKLHESSLALVEIFEDLDLLRLISSGSLLIVASSDKNISKVLKDNGIDCEVIGTFTDKNEKLIKRNNGNIETIKEPKSDELWSILDQLK